MNVCVFFSKIVQGKNLAVGYTACETYCLKDAKSVDEMTLIKVHTAWGQLSSIEMS